jgi:hypothetical protein
VFDQSRGNEMAEVSHVLKLSAAALIAVSLAACGGGGGSRSRGPSVNPPPPPPPPPPPATETPGTFSADFAVPVTGVRMTGTIDLETGAISGADIPALPANDEILVQENAGEYAIWSGHSVWDYDFPIFQSGDLGRHPTTGDEESNFDYFRYEYDDSSGTHLAELQLLNDSPSNSRIQLTYLTYGIYFDAAGPQSARSFNTGVFLLGQETTAANMPRTGSGTYSGIVDGYASFGGTGYRLLGSTGTLTANFATGGISTSLFLSGNSDFLTGTSGAFRTFGTLSGTGAITSGTNEYSGDLSGFGMIGAFAGQFFGPAANETGYAFGAVGGGDTIAGVFVGK